MWLHRLKKLLHLCIVQITTDSQSSPAIPLRMLETFSAESSIERYVENEELIQNYLGHIFQYLIQKDYYSLLRSLLELKCPPLDGETLHAPNQFSEAIFQLMLRPLLLANNSDAGYLYSSNICLSFTKQVLSLPFTESIRYFILPCLSECSDFPFEFILKNLKKLCKSQLPERMEVDSTRNVSTFTRASTTKESTFRGKQNDSDDSKFIFSSYLLHSLLMLDRKQLSKYI